jgi:hypothetical protein
MNRRNGNWLARSIDQRTATAATVRAALSGYRSINGAAVRLSSRAPSLLPLPTYKSHGYSMDVCCRRRLQSPDAMPRCFTVSLDINLYRRLLSKTIVGRLFRAAASPKQNDLSCSPRWGGFPFHMMAGEPSRKIQNLHRRVEREIITEVTY